MRNFTTEGTPEPESVPKGTPRAEPTKPKEPLVAVEPLPEWDLAQQTWQWTWELHWAGLGTAFSLLALYALLSMIGLVTNKKHRRKPRLALAISCLLFIFGTSRALFLFINPYESEQCFLLNECPVILTRILHGIALPCITASFSLIHLAFLQLSKLNLYPEKLQSAKFLSGVVAFHFVLVLFTEIMVTFYGDLKVLSITCHAFFIAMSLILSGSFIYSGRIIVKTVQETQLSVLAFGNQSNRERQPNVTKLVKITYITVLVGFASCALQLYSMFAVYQLHKDDRDMLPSPVPWLIFQSLYRIVEVVAGGTMAYVSPRQVSYRRTANTALFHCCRLPLVYAQNQSTGDSEMGPVGRQNIDEMSFTHGESGKCQEFQRPS